MGVLFKQHNNWAIVMRDTQRRTWRINPRVMYILSYHYHIIYNIVYYVYTYIDVRIKCQYEIEKHPLAVPHSFVTLYTLIGKKRRLPQ